MMAVDSIPSVSDDDDEEDQDDEEDCGRWWCGPMDGQDGARVPGTKEIPSLGRITRKKDVRRNTADGVRMATKWALLPNYVSVSPPHPTVYL